MRGNLWTREEMILAEKQSQGIDWHKRKLRSGAVS
jgi:hypothetical protein